MKRDNYCETILAIRENYCRRHMEEAEEWLNNDILSYMNNYEPSIRGFSSKFREIINRGEPVRIKNMDAFLDRLDKMSCHAANNILWEKLMPNERTEFVQRHTHIHR